MDRTIHLGFRPDPDRAARLDRRMHVELGRSLSHVLERSAGQLEWDGARLDALVSHLGAGGPVRPLVFGAYYDLVMAIGRGERSDADAALRRLEGWSAPYAREVIAFRPDELGEEYAQIDAKWSEGEGALPLVRPTAELANGFRDRLTGGLDLLERALPELRGEIDAIIRQIVIVGKDPSAKYHMDGASHYQLWGALFLNGAFHPDRIAVAEVLAHETAHSLLFGFCTDEPLVRNPDEERYASPLRADLRPMDGIYHATFVSARMHWAMTALMSSPHLTEAERAHAAKAAEADRVNFHAGDGVIRAHGDLTGLGRSLIEGARREMDAADAAAV